MPSGKRLPDELSLKAVELYAQGVQIPKIAQKLKIKTKTIQNWKRRNWPEKWEKKRRARLEKTAQILEEESIEDLVKSSIRHQKYLRIAQGRAAQRIADSKDNELSAHKAYDALPEMIQAERELFVEGGPKEVLKIKNRAYSLNIAAGAVAKGGEEANAMAFLETSFTEIHGQQPKSEPTNLPPAKGSGKAGK